MDKYKVLIVDDEEINIDLLKNTLSDIYNIYVATDGFTCIDIMKKVKPNIVLLDVVMPVRDGFETLEYIKRDPEIAETPVILITALKDVNSVTKGFDQGIEDYITKPFNLSEIKARVKTHIEINSSKKEIKDLLMKTLGGAINMLMEILSISNPDAFAISNRIKELVKKIAKKMFLFDVWKLELAGMLSLIGCHAIPVLSLEKILLGQKVPYDEQKLFDLYPENGAKLVAKIPRLEDVAKMIGAQNNFMGNVEFDRDNPSLLGMLILNHAVHFELIKAKGIPGDVAIRLMAEEKGKYNNKILEILREIVEGEKELRYRDINLQVLESGMILGKDIRNKAGKLVVKKDMVISDILKEHLLVLLKSNEITNPISIKTR